MMQQLIEADVCHSGSSFGVNSLTTRPTSSSIRSNTELSISQLGLSLS